MKVTKKDCLLLKERTLPKINQSLWFTNQCSVSVTTCLLTCWSTSRISYLQTHMSLLHSHSSGLQQLKSKIMFSGAIITKVFSKRLDLVDQSILSTISCISIGKYWVEIYLYPLVVENILEHFFCFWHTFSCFLMFWHTFYTCSAFGTLSDTNSTFTALCNTFSCFGTLRQLFIPYVTFSSVGNIKTRVE